MYDESLFFEKCSEYKVYSMLYHTADITQGAANAAKM